ncbi:MAG: 4Fe-4S binding protein [Firmicutes bacterium]|nr:4Fe-4S binding protein [Bacillota bacterium]
MNRVRGKKAFVKQEECVACGCCVKLCPAEAIKILNGLAAKVDRIKCLGCGKCAKECPASVIRLQEVEE